MAALLIRLFIKDRDNVKDKNVRKKYGYLGSCTGIILNIMLFLGKLIAGLVSGAVSVMADAFNNLSDAGSSIMSLVGFKMAAKAADEDHPFGHGRMEYISGLVISFIIMMMSIELGKSSFLERTDSLSPSSSWICTSPSLVRTPSCRHLSLMSQENIS